MMRDFAVGLALIACLSCSPRSGPQVGGETHWLALCRQDADCGDDSLSCICGTCTRVCSGDRACSGGACYDAKSPLLLHRCEDLVVEETPAICLAQCDDDEDCGSGRSCAQGACVPDAVDAGMPDASTPVNIDDFADVSEEVPWTEPVELPTPSLVIEGAEDWILGSWTDGCTPGVPPECRMYVFERDADGNVRGYFQRERAHAPPPPRPTDGSVGYPVDAEPADYRLYSSPYWNVRYRVFDGSLSGDVLTFRWSVSELWRDWCKLQRPFRWEVAGRTLYYCVPQDPAQQAEIDEGKVVLCRSSTVEALCEAGTIPGPYPCACLDPEHDDPRCSASVCSCNATRCDLPSNLTVEQLQFSADRSTARYLTLDESRKNEGVTLRKVIP